MLNILQRSLLTVGFFTLCLHSAYAQQSGNRVITGIVQNAEGQKLPGVNVTVKGPIPLPRQIVKENIPSRSHQTLRV